MAETEDKKQTVAVIDIGSSAVRMVVAEVGPKTEIRYLENLQKPVKFGKDVFTNGQISNVAMREGIGILKNFKSVIDSYGVKKIQAVTTSAVRDASNRDNFIDQVYVRTGIDVEVLEGPEENRLELIAVENTLGESLKLDQKNCLIVEVGSGSTEMIILSKGQVEVTQTIPMGSIRLPEEVVSAGKKTDSVLMQRYLKRNIHDVVAYTAKEYSLDSVNVFIALGGDMRFAAQQLCEKKNEPYSIIQGKEFESFVKKIAKLTPEEIASQYGIPYTQAETLYPSLLFYLNFLAETKAEEIVVPLASIRDALLMEQAQLLSGYKRTDLAKQVMNSARHLGQKYQYDQPHAACVAALSVKLFDLLKEEHGMSSRERMLLEAAALLHDIGTYISPTKHNVHSSYLIDASDLFGLRKSDKNIVSNVVRFHRGKGPRAKDVSFLSLPRTDRAIVTKLAAILRVADALDNAHQQKIRNFVLEKHEDNFTIWVSEDAGDIALERTDLMDKGKMFSEVFGVLVLLKQGKLPELEG